MNKFYICTKSCTSLPVQYIAGKMYRMDETGCIYGEDHCGRYPENTDSEFREATKIEIEIEKYFQGHWPGTETAEQCNTSMSFTPLAILRLVEHFYKCGEERTKNDYHYVSDNAIKLMQKSWYLEGWTDHKFDQPAQFEIGPDLEQKYHPSHMSAEDVQALVDRAYENGKKDKEEELKKNSIHCKVFLHDGGLLMDYTQEQQDEVLEKIGADIDDKVILIILKDE